MYRLVVYTMCFLFVCSSTNPVNLFNISIFMCPSILFEDLLLALQAGTGNSTREGSKSSD